MTPIAATWSRQERARARRQPCMRKPMEEYDRWKLAHHPSLRLVYTIPAEPKLLGRPFDQHVIRYLEYKHMKCPMFVRAVVDCSDVTMAELMSPFRYRRVVRARQAAAWIIRKHTGRSATTIAKALGLLNHTTVLHACRQVDANYDNYRDLIETVEKQLGI